jgi:hypothetical protein
MMARRRSAALAFAADRSERDITQIDVAAALQPEGMNMCRLIGFASPVPTTLTEQIGKDEVARFGDMSALHADGWGPAWLQPEAAHPQRLQLERYRSIDRARAIRASPNWPNEHPPWRSWCIFAGRPRGSRCRSRTPIRSRRMESRWRTTGPFRHDRCWTRCFPGCESVAARDHGQ